MDRYPALYYGLAMVTGVALAYGVWPPLVLILLCGELRKRVGFGLVALCACVEAIYFMPELPKSRIDGIGYYRTEKIQNVDHSFNYRGMMKCFVTKDHVYYDIPCSFFRTALLPDASDYIVDGSLRPTSRGTYTLHASFEPVAGKNNLSGHRFRLKEKFRNYLKQNISDDLCYSFFASLGTGEIESRLLGLQFSKVGLNHTLAISGFHYTWLIFILGSLFHLFLSKRKTSYILLIIVSLYFLFIGETPSLNRAWLAAIIYLAGYLLKESVSGLNSLGLALLISLILDPLAMNQIGFQLSYLATFSLLAIYPSFEKILRSFFPKRQGFRYILPTFCRNTIALTFAVNLATLPLILYHFHYFPFLSLFFNLFFPVAITVCMALLIFSPIPIIGPPILSLAEWYTTPILNMIFYGVDTLEGGIWTPNIPLDLLIALLIAVVALGFYLEHQYHLTRISKTM